MKFLTVLGAIFVSSSALAVSFDCAKASTFAEKTICSDPLLRKLDDALSKNYKEMLGADFGGSVNGLRNEQREWIANRNKCTTRDCLVVAYKKRIDETCDYGVVSGVHPDCVHAEDLERTQDADIVASQEVLATAHVAAHALQPKTYLKWKDKTGKVTTCTEDEMKCFGRLMDTPDIVASLEVQPGGRRLSYGGVANFPIPDVDVDLTDEEILSNPQKVVDQANALESEKDPIQIARNCLQALKVGMTEQDALHCGKPTHQVHRSDGAAALQYLFGYYGNEGYNVVVRKGHIIEIEEFK